ncbi:unnamed protein product [Vicia faba]|uniref:Uncharacterized protein n=1 Tax=Vicia faba TaxID=3906 RepID=A0AAV1BAD3_VICFA|nr:unnamed protein product [Vicia faba]CAI8619561.1 unnamed protein product [Vicia faba]
MSFKFPDLYSIIPYLTTQKSKISPCILAAQSVPPKEGLLDVAYIDATNKRLRSSRMHKIRGEFQEDLPKRRPLLFSSDNSATAFACLQYDEHDPNILQICDESAKADFEA